MSQTDRGDAPLFQVRNHYTAACGAPPRIDDLADRLARHYLNTNDLHDLLRSFAHLSGTLIRQADGGLMVCLQPPDLPLHRRALAGLCADLNLDQPVFPGTDIPVRYEVAATQPNHQKTRHIDWGQP